MPRYKMKDSDYETPPENVYFFDLVGIDTKDGSKGPFLRWRWVIADIPEQDKFSGTYATSLTPITPTVNNRFGKFLDCITGNAEVGQEGDTDALVDAKIRIKGFLEHNKGTNNAGEDVVYCNVKKLLEGTAQKGVGVGRQDLDESGKTKQPAKDETAKTAEPKAETAKVGQAQQPPGNIPW